MEPELINDNPDKKKKGSRWGCLIAIFIILGIFLSVFISGFLDFSKKAKQSEAWSNMQYISEAEEKYFIKNNKFGNTFSEIGWVVEGKPRYAYFLSPTEHIGRPLSELGLKLPVDFKAFGAPIPGASATGFTLVSIGNIDRDDKLDVWSINDGYKAYNLHQKD